MNITDDDIEGLIRRFRSRWSDSGLSHSEQYLMKKVATAIEDWLDEVREAGKVREERLVCQILGTGEKAEGRA